MKKISLLFFLASSYLSYAQVDVTSTAGNQTTTSYGNLKSAFDAINAGVHQGIINIIITASTSETATAILNANGTGTTSYTNVLIKPKTNVTIAGNLNSSIINILGSNVTIDGAITENGTTRDLTIQNFYTTAPVINIGSASSTAPVSNSAIKNTIIDGHLVSNGVPGGTYYAVVLANGSGNTAGYFNNITFQNNEVKNALGALYVNGVYSASTESNNGDGLFITQNNFTNNIASFGVKTLGVSGASEISFNSINITNPVVTTSATSPITLAPIWLNYTSNAKVHDNNITGISAPNSPYSIFAGIYIQNTFSYNTKYSEIYNNTISNINAGGHTGESGGISISSTAGYQKIFNNKITGIHNLNTATSSATSGYSNGIGLTSSRTGDANIYIYNNFISNITSTYNSATAPGYSSGIFYNTNSPGVKIYNNTVNLSTVGTNETGISAGFFVNSTSVVDNALDVRNNIFNNSKTTGERYAIYSLAPNTIFTDLNYNDYATTGTDLGYIGFARTTLADVVTGFGKNANSINVTPTFTSATDLHLQVVNANKSLDNIAARLTDITTDIDGDARGTLTDIGADEVDFSSLAVINDSKKSNIAIYPNPFSDVLRISDLSGVATISINDMTGRSVKTIAPTKEHDLSSLKAGLYIVNLKMEDGSVKSFKAIKK